VAFTGDTLLVLDGADRLTAWQPRTGRKQASLAFDKPAPEAKPRYFPVADDRHVFAARGKDLRQTTGKLARWEKQTVLPGRIVALLETEGLHFLAVALDSGKGFVPGRPYDVSYGLSIRNADTLEETKAIKFDAKPLVFQMAFFSGRNDQVVTMGKDGVFTVWDMKTGNSAGSFIHPAPRKDGRFMYPLTVAPGGKLKTYCCERVMGYGAAAVYAARLWAPLQATTISLGERRK
jgi:hypothetical protein